MNSSTLSKPAPEKPRLDSVVFIEALDSTLDLLVWSVASAEDEDVS